MSQDLVMLNPYEAPGIDQKVERRLGSSSDLIIARCGLWLYRAPVIASLVVAILMGSHFEFLAKNQSADAAELSEGISKVLWVAIIGLGLGLAGWVLAVVSLFRPFPGRRPSFFSWIILSAVYAFFGFPAGTACGLFLIGLVLKKRREFGVGRVNELDVSEVD